MRCPDCAKFVSMDNADPEVNDIQVEYSADDTSVHITADVRHARTCADCGQELKALDISFENDVDITELEGYQALSPEDKVRLLESLKDGTGRVEIDSDSTESDESGGSRYKKNMISVTINYKLTVTNGVQEANAAQVAGPGHIGFEHEGQLVEENAASDYEEQV